MGNIIEHDELYGDEWTFAHARSKEELARVRAMIVAQYDITGYTPEEFTCDTCVRAPICKLAFDLYSTNGDCLWEK